MTQASEFWTPRCPQCGMGTPCLAPANGFTKHIMARVEVYCPNCQWRAHLADVIKSVFVRV